MNMRLVNRLFVGCLCVPVMIIVATLISRLWGGPSEELNLVIRVVCGVTLVVVAFCLIRFYQSGEFGGIPGKLSLPDKSRLELLKEHAEYDRSRQEKPYTYEFRMGGKVPAILEKYDYSKYLKAFLQTFIHSL